MSNVAKLKKRALEYEQKKQFDKALETYVQILANLGTHIDEADVALYNRVGDLLLRKGDVSGAVDHYERAVDLYAEGGFFNNAIALCNKILRNAPGRNSVYYKLGKISAQKGFINDAKQNFLEYADRMQRIGELEEAFRALKEFADLCPDQDDIRLMLADQLVRRDRKAEAIEQLQLLYDKFQAEGRTREAHATVERMKAIDPSLEPKQGPARPTPKANDLIFLDVNYDEPLGRGASTGTAARAPGAAPKPAAPVPPVSAPAPDPGADFPGESIPTIDLPSLDTPVAPVADRAAEPPAGLSHGAALGPERPSAGADLVSHVDSGLITGFEQTALGGADAVSGLDPAQLQPLSGLEPPMAAELPEVIEPITIDRDLQSAIESSGPTAPPLGAPGVAPANAPGGEGDLGGELTLIYPDDMAPGSTGAAAPAGGDLELIYVPEPDPAPPAARAPGVPVDTKQSVGAHEPIGHVVDRLRAAAARAPGDWNLRRQLAEALLEQGEREAGLAELEAVMLGFEESGDLRGASAVAEELILVEPNAVRFHQKRVEYAVRANDKSRLADAYIALAESLFRAGQLDKSRAVYARVIELAPDDPRARAALQAVGAGNTPVSSPRATPVAAPAPRPAPAPRFPASRAARNGAGGGGAHPAAPVRPAQPPRPEAPAGRSAARAAPRPRPQDVPAPAAEAADAGFVNLSDWLRDEEAKKSTRMVADVEEPEDHEQVDFAEMLSIFKEGVAANVDETDHQAHYDLGVAYKEMGLLDEAISEFQKALRGTEERVRTYEALGQCFVEKQQYQIALTILSRALNEKNHTDDMLVGVLYLLGYASEAIGRWDDARRYYERVFAVDIQFRDIGDRLAAAESHAQ